MPAITGLRGEALVRSIVSMNRAWALGRIAHESGCIHVVRCVCVDDVHIRDVPELSVVRRPGPERVWIA